MDRERTKLLEELSKVNNELTTLQRELSKKNAELERLNAELEKTVITDELTRVFNRRYFNQQIEKERRRAERLGYKIALVSIDLNDFKKVNDEYGHHEGDKVLKRFADFLKKKLRESVDSIYRFGGDEFVLLLVNSDKERAQKIMNRINREFSSLNEMVSLSYGIVELAGPKEPKIKQALELADQRMYIHKKELKKN